jgi:hypothetical protein
MPVQLGVEKAQLEADAGRLQADFETAADEMASMKARQAELKEALVGGASRMPASLYFCVLHTQCCRFQAAVNLCTG